MPDAKTEQQQCRDGFLRRLRVPNSFLLACRQASFFVLYDMTYFLATALVERSKRCHPLTPIPVCRSPFNPERSGGPSSASWCRGDLRTALQCDELNSSDYRRSRHGQTEGSPEI